MNETRQPADEEVLIEELREAWVALSPDERLEGFRLLDGESQEEFFLRSDTLAQTDLLAALPDREASWRTLRDGTRMATPRALSQMTAYVLEEQRDWFEAELPFVRRPNRYRCGGAAVAREHLSARRPGEELVIELG